MPKYRGSLASDKNQISPSSFKKNRSLNTWWVISSLLATIVGGVIGSFSLPNPVTDIVDPNYALSAEGVRVFTVGGGALASLSLAIWLGVVLADKERRKPLLVRLGLCLGICAVALIGAILGDAYLPHMLIDPLRIFVGIIVGLIGLAFLVGLFKDPAILLEEAGYVAAEGCIHGCVEGCFSWAIVLLAVTSMIGGGVLLWHLLV